MQYLHINKTQQIMIWYKLWYKLYLISVELRLLSYYLSIVITYYSNIMLLCQRTSIIDG